MRVKKGRGGRFDGSERGLGGVEGQEGEGKQGCGSRKGVAVGLRVRRGRAATVKRMTVKSPEVGEVGLRV